MPKGKSGSFDQGKYVAEYMRNNIKQVHVSLNRGKAEDMEMLEWLQGQPEGASGYIKKLIKEDMKRGCK